MKYSVIIPVYNCMHYLESCVESVFNQNVDSEYEIILIDDGSTDGSSQLCDRLAETNSCIRVIHQANQGVSAARNAGISAAMGDYLLFLDADDFWNEDLLQQMEVATKTQPDIVQFGYHTFYEDGHVTEHVPPSIVDGETGKDYVMRILDQGMMPAMSCWASAHRKEFLLQNEICFPRGVVFGEDLMFRMHELTKAQKICNEDAPLYRYRRNAASVTRNMSLKKMHDICVVWPEMYRRFPKPIIADYYCMNLVSLAELSCEDASTLLPLLSENRAVLSAVRGKKPRIARAMFKLFGYYNGARIIKFLIGIKNG